MTAAQQRAVQAAGARPGQDVRDEAAPERLRQRRVDTAGVVGAGLLLAEGRAAGAIELDRHAAHPDRQADAAVPRDRDADLLVLDRRGRWWRVGGFHDVLPGFPAAREVPSVTCLSPLSLATVGGAVKSRSSLARRTPYDPDPA